MLVPRLRMCRRLTRFTPLHTQRCGKCRGRLAPLQKLLADGTPSKRQQGPGVYATFVKQNFKKVKADNPHLSSSQVMSKLGELWKTRQAGGLAAGADLAREIEGFGAKLSSLSVAEEDPFAFTD